MCQLDALKASRNSKCFRPHLLGRQLTSARILCTKSTLSPLTRHGASDATGRTLQFERLQCTLSRSAILLGWACCIFRLKMPLPAIQLSRRLDVSSPRWNNQLLAVARNSTAEKSTSVDGQILLCRAVMLANRWFMWSLYCIPPCTQSLRLRPLLGSMRVLTCGFCALSGDMKLPSGKRKTMCVVSLVGPGGFLIKHCFLGYI